MAFRNDRYKLAAIIIGHNLGHITLFSLIKMEDSLLPDAWQLLDTRGKSLNIAVTFMKLV